MSTRANPPIAASPPAAGEPGKETAGGGARQSPGGTGSRGPRVPAAEAKRRILEAARRLLEERPFGALTVGDVMAEAGLTRTIFYRLFDDLPALAADLLPDSDDPLIDHVERVGAEHPEQVVPAMIDGLVDVYAVNGRLLRAMTDAARQDPAFAARMDTALTGPRALLARLVAAAPNPPPDPEEFARMLMTVHRDYLLDRFGDGDADTPEARRAARDALTALWDRLLT